MSFTPFQPFRAFSGGAAPFSPLSLSPALWLDAADAATLYDATTGGSLVAADGEVARWEDKSGLGNHATQTVLSERPIHKASIQNGKSALLFDGITKRFTHAMNVDTATIIAAYRLITLQTSFRGLYAAGASTAADGVMFLTNSGAGKWGSWGGSLIQADSNHTTDAVIHAMTTNGSGNAVAFRKNGTSDGNRTANPYGHGSRHVGGHTGQQSHMYLFELLVLTRVLTASEISSCESYLAAKWGISVA